MSLLDLELTQLLFTSAHQHLKNVPRKSRCGTDNLESSPQGPGSGQVFGRHQGTLGNFHLVDQNSWLDHGPGGLDSHTLDLDYTCL